MRLFVLEDLIGVWVGRVEGESVGQNKSHRVKRAIGILGHAAAHTAGVIGQDAAHHARINGSGVGADAAAIGFEHMVDEAADEAGLETDVSSLIFNAVISPMFGDVHQDSVGHGLTRETGPCRAEGHRDFVLLCKFEQGLYFADGTGLHHRLRHQPKIRGVVGIGKAVNQAGVDAGVREDGVEVHIPYFTLGN